MVDGVVRRPAASRGYGDISEAVGLEDEEEGAY